MRSTHALGTLAVGVALLLAVVPAPATSSPATTVDQPAPSALYDELTAAQAACLEDACRTQAVTGAADGLSAHMTAIPHGQPGTQAWIHLATDVAGWEAHPDQAVSDLPLDEALIALHEQAGMTIDDALSERIQAQVADLSPAATAELTDLVNAMVTVQTITDQALDGADLTALRADPVRAMHLATVVATTPADQLPAPLVSEWNGLVQALEAVDRAKLATAAHLLAGITADPTALEDTELELPFVLVGAEGDTVHTTDRVLLIDRSGDDTYLNSAGSGLGGIGAGLTIDQGDGQETYQAEMTAQAGMLGGVGRLVDQGGADTYSVTSFGQAFAAAGIALLEDRGTGDDRYASPATETTLPIATKGAGLGGIGVLIDGGGNDWYRQDALDGFAYGAAGGVGLIADRGDGDDTYLSEAREISLLGDTIGNFTGPVQVSSEISGTAILQEEGGDDTYTCGERVRQGCQAAGGPSSVALLLDAGGHDAYRMGESIVPALVEGTPVTNFPMGQGAAYSIGAPTTGPGIALLDDVSGDDTYTAERWAQGYGSAGLGILRDQAGTDTYDTVAPVLGERADGQMWFDGAGQGIGIDE